MTELTSRVPQKHHESPKKSEEQKREENLRDQLLDVTKKFHELLEVSHQVPSKIQRWNNPSSLRRGTSELAWMVCHRGQDVTAAEINSFLDTGADIYHDLCCSVGEEPLRPIFHTLIFTGKIDAVAAAMQHKRGADFTAVDESGRNPIHILCACPQENQKVKDMLAHILRRVKDPNLRTTVNWRQVTLKRQPHHDFLTIAAAHCRLDVILSEFVASNISFHPEHTKKIDLGVIPELRDWKEMTVENKRKFYLFYDMESRVEEELNYNFRALVKNSGWNPAGVGQLPQVAQFVQQGADVMAWIKHPDYTFLLNILSWFIWAGPMEVVEELLRTTREINFSLPDRDGFTAMHYVFCGWGKSNAPRKTPNEVKHVLNLILDHMEKNPNDTINWGHTDKDGMDAISVASRNGFLSPFVEVLLLQRPVPYFSEQEEIELQHSALENDVLHLKDHVLSNCGNQRVPAFRFRDIRDEQGNRSAVSITVLTRQQALAKMGPQVLECEKECPSFGCGDGRGGCRIGSDNR